MSFTKTIRDYGSGFYSVIISLGFLTEGVALSPGPLKDVDRKLGSKRENCLSFCSGTKRKSINKLEVALEIEKRDIDLDRYDKRRSCALLSCQISEPLRRT